MSEPLLSIADVAKRFGVFPAHIHKLLWQRLIPAENVHRAGSSGAYVFYESEIPIVRAALEQAGRLSPTHGPTIGGENGQ